jgi:hypothetical protein
MGAVVLTDGARSLKKEVKEVFGEFDRFSSSKF